MAGGTSCVKVRRGFSSAGSSPSNSSERFCSDVDMSVWWKKKCFSCAWKKEQASSVRVLSSAHCINELCKHQRTFDLQNASMKGVMFVYPASHVMGVPSSRQLVSRIPIMDFQSHDYRNDAAIIIILFWTFLIVSNSPELSVDSHTW